jgi:hypothetical protein
MEKKKPPVNTAPRHAAADILSPIRTFPLHGFTVPYGG